MGTTELDTVYYPDLDDVDQPNVWAATMAQSVSDGIGARLRKQEQFIGFMGHLPKQVWPKLANGQEYGPLPFQVIQGSGSFNQGMQVAGGVITIPVAGLYAVSLSATITAANAEFNAFLYLNTTAMWKGYTQATASAFGYNTGSVVLNCAAGDKLSAKVTLYGSTNGSSIKNTDYIDNVLSVALLKAS